MQSYSQDALKADFRVFLTMVWEFLGLPKPTPIQYDIADFLQSQGTRKVIEAFRGIGKSWITASFVLWVLLRDPQKKVLVVSATKQLADSFSTFAMRLLNEVPALAHLTPSPEQRSSKIAWDVGPALPAIAPSVKSVGLTGHITGSRADLIIPDDIEIPNNSSSQLEREQLAVRIEEFESVLTPKPDSAIVYLGTPQNAQTVYNILPGRGFTVRVWPGRYPSEAQALGYGDHLAPIITRTLLQNPKLVGRSTEPSRFPEAVLIGKEQGMGRSTFALQFMLNTSIGDHDRYPLKLADFIVMDLNKREAPEKVSWASGRDQVINDPKLPNMGLPGDRFYGPLWVSKEAPLPYVGGVLAIDPSGRGKDELGYAVVKYLHGLLWVTAWGGIHGNGYGPETLEALAEIAKDHGVTKVVVEKNFGDGMFTSLLTPVLTRVYPVSIEEVYHSQQKEKRIIDTLEPLLNSHRIVLDKKIIKQDYDTAQAGPWGQELAKTYCGLYQLTRITRDRGSLVHDDRLDALSIACSYWVTQMNRDVDTAVAVSRLKAVQALIAETMEWQVAGAPYLNQRAPAGRIFQVTGR